MNRILVADPLHAAGLEILRQSGSEVHLLTAEERPELAEMIDGFDALIVRSMTQVDGALLRQGKSLKVVGRAGIGVDNVDVATATELGILVVNAPTANLVSATEHTFALLLALARNVPAAHQSLLAGEWDRKRFIGTELNGKTLGLIGLGRIGQNVAYRAKAFGMKVLAFDPFLDASAARRLDVELSELAALLKRSDVVSVHTPLTDQTRGLLDGAAISGMKAGALLVNCARGGVVDEKAVLEALESGHLGGVALDVFEHEPPTGLQAGGSPQGSGDTAYRGPDPRGAGEGGHRNGTHGARSARRIPGADCGQSAVLAHRWAGAALRSSGRAAGFSMQLAAGQ